MKKLLIAIAVTATFGAISVPAQAFSVKGCTISTPAPANKGGRWFLGKGILNCTSNHRILQFQVWMNWSNWSNGWNYIANSSGTFYHAGGYAGVTGYSREARMPHGDVVETGVYYNIDGASGFYSSNAYSYT